MLHSRRSFLATGAAALGAAPLSTLAPPVGAKDDTSPEAILALFKSLPGDIAIKIHAPATDRKPEFLVESNASKKIFVGSAIKTFILCESLRQVDSPNVVQSITTEQLTLDSSVWNLDSATFNPPNLIGKVSQRTALEAMIMHSDNTGTDMCIKHAGPDKVRAFIASAGPKDTTIPESTRVFFGYLLGSKSYQTFSWADIGAAANLPVVNSPLNDTETLASSANDFVSYYSRALHGDFFQHKETLNEFRRILSLGDAIWLLPLPLGVSAFCKGGSIDVEGFHAVCAPGGMFFGNRWVYFCLAINWTAKAETDPATVAAFAAAASRAMTLTKQAL
jgi:beta-lactamase class A